MERKPSEDFKLSTSIALFAAGAGRGCFLAVTIAMFAAGAGRGCFLAVTIAMFSNRVTTNMKKKMF
eukprot:Awhi_evm1s9915